jgi:hypothetical protein
MQAQQDLAHPETVERVEKSRRILRPRAHADAEAVERHRRAIEILGERAVAPPDARRRERRRAEGGGVRRQIGEPHGEALPTPGVLVRLVGERVPDDAVARRGARGRGRNVGVRAARDEEAPDPGEGRAQARLRLVLPQEAAVIAAIERDLRRVLGRRLTEVRAEEEVLIRGAERREARKVAHALARGERAVQARPVQVEQVETGGVDPSRVALAGAAPRREQVAAGQVAMPDAGGMQTASETGDRAEQLRAVDPRILRRGAPGVQRAQE